MLERPNLSDAEIAGALQMHYGIITSCVAFLPIGNDASSFTFKVNAADGMAYFLKARRGEVNTPAQAIPHYVKAHGVPAVAPITTLTGALCANAGAFTLIVYPFIDGASGMHAGMTDAQWVAYGAGLRKMHDLQLPEAVLSLLPVEDFGAGPYFQEVLLLVDSLIGSAPFNNDVLRDLAEFWRSKAHDIQHLARRTRVLGDALKDAAWRGVLCHADIHTANVMIDGAGAVHFVDWDQPIHAPKERDLMFIIGASGSVGADARQEALFFQGYGQVDVDWPILAYYRHLWVMQDLGDYAERAFLMDDAGDETRTHAAAGFKAMFDAGDAIDIARRADSRLS